MQRRQRRAHQVIWWFLAILIPVVVAIAVFSNPTGNSQQPAEPLDDRAKQVEGGQG
ncbi:hypothetical protein PUV47_09355 [Pseudovibrio exalbescens]|uniref:hypothetical protein n=1 Tax=Pseudovibrio exalbescens TaxID=197461 RepID=UPI002365DBD2|nr:hypothetical protein [Pseudovibrio exalbescens]MDD7910124.1 hypothetical protein [Pseudovibrio exalbescens]